MSTCHRIYRPPAETPAKNQPRQHVFEGLACSDFFDFEGELYIKVSHTHGQKIHSCEPCVPFAPQASVSGVCVDIIVTDYLT